jgi:hypothetical protein
MKTHELQRIIENAGLSDTQILDKNLIAEISELTQHNQHTEALLLVGSLLDNVDREINWLKKLRVHQNKQGYLDEKSIHDRSAIHSFFTRQGFYKYGDKWNSVLDAL